MVVNKYPAERVAATLRRVVGGDNFSNTTQFTVSEQKVENRAKAATLLSSSFRGITLSLWATYFMGLMVIYLLSGWLPTMIKEAGLPIERAANITAMFQLGGTVGALMVGIMMDRWTPNRVIASTYIAGACCILLLASTGVQASVFSIFVLLAGFCMSGAQTGLNAFAPSCYPTAVRATGVSWMQGIGRFGSIFGSFAGGVLLSLGWGFAPVIAILAIPATIAALSIVFTRFAARSAAVA
jgi:AAHS family 4-hydroxybenzoate transporter-like MFS transporter